MLLLGIDPMIQIRVIISRIWKTGKKGTVIMTDE
jgi:hypothetical protein